MFEILFLFKIMRNQNFLQYFPFRFMTHNISRSSKKYKTSILFQVKHNQQKSIEVGQSLNIIALRKGNLNKIPSQPQQSYNHKAALIDNFIKKQKFQRKQNKNPKISIQLKNGSLFDELDGLQINEKNIQRNEFNSFKSHNLINKQQNCNTVQKIRRDYKISLDQQKGKLTCHVDQFQCLCSDFINKIQDLQFQKQSMVGKMERYKSYFRQLKIKQNERSPQKPQKNAQLKILNLQKKVETLNYIIKNYRKDNKQEIKNFEKKVNEYKPNLEDDLVQMLADANSKNDQLEQKINYFQKQCQKYYKNGNWVEIVRKMQQKDLTISKMQKDINQLKQSLQQRNKVDEKYTELQQQLKMHQQKYLDVNTKYENLKVTLNEQHKAYEKKQKQNYELQRKYEEIYFKYEGLLAVQKKIIEKQDQIIKNSIMITRLQNQNNCLKAKIETLSKNFNEEFFEGSSNSIEKIEQMNMKIDELSLRFSEQIDKKTTQKSFNRQIQLEFLSFIMHIFQKVKDFFQKIINQYIKKMQEFILQKKQLHSIFDHLNQSNRIKQQKRNTLLQEIYENLSKRKRCTEGVQKFNSISETVGHNNCSSCKNWMLHYGQLDTVYQQLYQIIQQKG